MCKNLKLSFITILSLLIFAFATASPTTTTSVDISSPIKTTTPAIPVTSKATVKTQDSNLFTMLNNLKNMHAQFRQTLLNPQQSLKEISTGEFWVSKPSFFKWQIESPQKQMLLSNGQELWNYDEDLAQITISDVPDNIAQAPYLLLLSGDSQTLKKLFNITQNTENSYRLTAKVKDQSLIKYIDINFAHHVPSSMLIQTEVGQSTHIEFYNISTAKIPATTYHFTPPHGVDVLG